LEASHSGVPEHAASSAAMVNQSELILMVAEWGEGGRF
jgi:hypothetical protein